MNKKSIFQLIDLLKYPVITEKSMKLLESNQYTFIVDHQSTKLELKKVIQFLFDVKVKKINILTRPLKTKSTGVKQMLRKGRKTKYKKAIIHLDKKDKIDIFDAKILLNEEN